MKEYKSVLIETERSIFGIAKGTANTAAVDDVLNCMAKDGWELDCLQDLQHANGSGSLLCVFCREKKK